MPQSPSLDPFIDDTLRRPGPFPPQNSHKIQQSIFVKYSPYLINIFSHQWVFSFYTVQKTQRVIHFLKRRGFNDIKYHILACNFCYMMIIINSYSYRFQDIWTRCSCVLSRLNYFWFRNSLWKWLQCLWQKIKLHVCPSVWTFARHSPAGRQPSPSPWPSMTASPQR